MKLKVKEYILEKDMITSGDTVWAALSGGADSCCLLHILKDLSMEMGFHLKAVHVNHLLRGDESDIDEVFCRSLCDGMGIMLSVFSKDVRKISTDNKMTVEEAGRKARYDVFHEFCAGKVALAHNMNDNAETLIMNLLRGSGTEGLGGISGKSGRYIRPLLKSSRDVIEKYCHAHNIVYMEDSSNQSTKYFRNAVRLQAIPLLNEISQKNVVPLLARTAETVKYENSYISDEAEAVFKKIVKTEKEQAEFLNANILKLHPVLTARVVRKAVEHVKGDLKDIEARNTDLIIEIIKKNKTGDATNLPGGINALVQFGKTIIYKESPPHNYEYELIIPGKIYIEEKNITIKAELTETAGKLNPSGDIHYFKAEPFNGRLYIRNRRIGDIIKPWKGSGTAKLKKYFIDKKVERPGRDGVMLFACGSSVAYIDGIEYGKDYMPYDGEMTLKVEIERGYKDA